MIAGVVALKPALNTVRGVLWLLGNRFGDALGAPELLGRRPSGAPKPRGGAVPQPLLLVNAQQVSGSPNRGVVLCLPRRRLQRWLLTEGRAWRGRGGGGRDDGNRWSPSWVEDGIDVMPPVLPGRTNEGGRVEAGADSVGINMPSGAIAPCPPKGGMGPSLSCTPQALTAGTGVSFKKLSY